MTIAIESQLAAFAGALLVGAALGLVYDSLRALGRSGPQWREWCLDLFFWVVAALAVFLSAARLENGEIRIYMLLGNLLGALLYFLLLARFFRRFYRWLDRAWQRFKALLLRPLRRIYAMLMAPLSIFFNFLKKRIKKIFSFSRRWVKMKAASKKMRKRRKTAERKERQHEGKLVHHQKGWYSLEDRRGGSPGLHHLHDGADAGEDRRSQ